MGEGACWYVVHTYSGYENTVADSIMKAAENRHVQDLIQAVNIPMETVKEVNEKNEVKIVERKIYPGYVLVKMVLTDESWHIVRNIRGVTGFLGANNKAIPLTDDEIAALGMEKKEVHVAFHVGDRVKVTDGPLEGFYGLVDEVDVDRERMRVIVSMFGRETPVDLDFEQVVMDD